MSKTVKGIMWSFTELLSKQGITLIIQIVLARLLLPEHFGLIGMITIFVAISTSLVQSGLDQALIREKKIGQRDYSTVFFFNLAISLLIYGVIFVSSPLISSFYGEPKLIPIIRVLMLVVVINAFTVIQRVILIRNIDFKTQTKITIFAGILSGIVAIMLAFNGAGVWSLVAQQITMQLMSMFLFFFHNRWFPSLIFDVVLFKKYFVFGYKLMVSGLIDTTYKNIYFVLIGRMYSTELLGYYTNATKLRDTSTIAISQALQRVTYPMLSKMQDESERLVANYKKLLQITSYCVFPLILGLVAIAPNLIPFLLGDKWIPSVTYFQLLCFAGMLYPIHAINLNVLKVKNRADLFLTLEIVKKIALTIFILISVLSDLGVEGLIYAAIVSSFFSLFINSYYSGKEINYSYWKQVRDMLPSLANSIMMGGTVFIIGVYLNIGLFPLIIVQIILGVLVYILLSIILKLKEFYVLFDLIKKLIRPHK